jgi:hypothetical protein
MTCQSFSGACGSNFELSWLPAISDISFSLPLDGSDRLIRYQSSKSKHLLLHPIDNKAQDSIYNL